MIARSGWKAECLIYGSGVQITAAIAANADILGTAGPAHRAGHAGHLSLGLKVMSATEHCRKLSRPAPAAQGDRLHAQALGTETDGHPARPYAITSTNIAVHSTAFLCGVDCATSPLTKARRGQDRERSWAWGRSLRIACSVLRSASSWIRTHRAVSPGGGFAIAPCAASKFNYVRNFVPTRPIGCRLDDSKIRFC